mmetsp:Transcript_975/g.1627  ORF Transcript_975/g.1627 Transcript_975/m.1627 type:complete len:287 (-) Transcript_975:3270-4130(-)
MFFRMFRITTIVILLAMMFLALGFDKRTHVGISLGLVVVVGAMFLVAFRVDALRQWTRRHARIAVQMHDQRRDVVARTKTVRIVPQRQCCSHWTRFFRNQQPRFLISHHIPHTITCHHQTTWCTIQWRQSNIRHATDNRLKWSVANSTRQTQCTTHASVFSDKAVGSANASNLAFILWFVIVGGSANRAVLIVQHRSTVAGVRQHTQLTDDVRTHGRTPVGNAARVQIRVGALERRDKHVAIVYGRQTGQHRRATSRALHRVRRHRTNGWCAERDGRRVFRRAGGE